MQINTKFFGEMNFDEKDILTFNTPLSGLPNSTRYALLKKDEDELFFWLQSIDEPTLCLCLIDMFKIMPEYNPEVPENQVMALGEINFDDIKTLNVLVIPENLENMTANLLAPIVINEKTKKAAQIITTNDNELSFKIFEKLGKRKDV